MEPPTRPSRLVDYFLTVGAVDTKNLKPYHSRTSKDDFFGTQSIDVISELQIVATDKDEDVPSNYYCMTKTVEGNYGGVNAGGYLNLSKHSGPFVAFKRDNKENVHPITNIAIRDVDEYMRAHPNVIIPVSSQKLEKKEEIPQKGSAMSFLKRRLSGSSKPKTKSDSNLNNNFDYIRSLPPPKASKKGVPWELVSGNLNKSSLGHKLQVWIARDPNSDPIIDLKIVNLSKNESIPHSFITVCNLLGKQISLNHGASHRDRLYLCFRTRNKHHFSAKQEQLFSAQILDRYPMCDYPEFPLTETVSQFCFPRGMDIIPCKSDNDDDPSVEDMNRLQCVYQSQQHTFVLSTEHGDRIYGACVIFYEERLGDACKVYLPKGICVLSHYPFYNGFLVFLNHIYRISMSPANNVPLEKYISHFFHSVPLPLSGHPGISYSIGTAKRVFALSPRFCLPNLSFPLEYLFRCLYISDVISLIGLLLLERQIVLVSKHYSLITPVAMALCALIWPLQYTYTFIPVLPESMSVFLEAPVPYIVGMHRSFHDELWLQNDVVSVDLDNHIVTISEDSGERQKPLKAFYNKNDEFCGKIPKCVKNSFIARVQKHVCLNIGVTENIHDKQDDEFFNVEAVRLAFLQFFIEIFGNYRQFLRYCENNTLQMHFDKELFVSSCPENMQTFVKDFVETNAFSHFIAQRTDVDVSKLHSDIITFDYFIEKTVAHSALSADKVQALNAQYLQQISDNESMDSGSVTSNNTHSSKKSRSSINKSNKKSKNLKKLSSNHHNKRLKKDLEIDLISQLKVMQLEDPYIEYKVFVVDAADYKPSDKELALAPYTYTSFPELNATLMKKYYIRFGRNNNSGSDSANSDSKTDNNNNSKDEFHSIHYSSEMSERDRLKSKSMDESYEVFVSDMLRSVNGYIDQYLKFGREYNANSPFIHRKVNTKTMNNTVAVFVNKIYETWYSVFNNHAINRLSIHTVSPKRDFIQCLIVFKNQLKKGFMPTELMMSSIALIPAHCSMHFELILLERWMIRLGMIPKMSYLQTIISASARKAHVEYRKFEKYYTDKQLPLPVRNEFAFHDQDPTDCYPFTQAVDCAPESFFDYFLTDLPSKLLIACKCQNCKKRLSGEEILAGFENLRVWQEMNKMRHRKSSRNRPTQTQGNANANTNANSNANAAAAYGAFKVAKSSTLTHHRKQASEPPDLMSMISNGKLPDKPRKRAASLNTNHMNGAAQSASISDNPHLPNVLRKKQFTAPNNAQIPSKKRHSTSSKNMRGSQWTTLCPFCSSETVAKIEIFGGINASEYESNLNKFMSFTMMNGNGTSRNGGSSSQICRKTFSLFCYKRLHERIQRIIGNSYPYFPTSSLPYSFPSAKTSSNSHYNNRNDSGKQDRAIKIIRSKEDLFWNVFFYFQSMQLPCDFLFGGMYEFEQKKSGACAYLFASLPHHSWCLVDAGTAQKGNSKKDGSSSAVVHVSDGLEKYYVCDMRLRAVHPTLYFSLKGMVNGRLYDALILVLQQRGVMSVNGAAEKSAASLDEMHAHVMREPLFRLFGKLHSLTQRKRSLVYTRSFNRACDRLSFAHKKRLILPQDSGVSNLFANRIQDVLLLTRDTYHLGFGEGKQENECLDTSDDDLDSEKYAISPGKFHMILKNHTFGQLILCAERANKQIAQITCSMEDTDALVSKCVSQNKQQMLMVFNEKNAFPRTIPLSAFWKDASESLSPMKRRRYSVQHPCYVPRLRSVLIAPFWLSQYRRYIYRCQPRRMKYIHFVLLIEEFFSLCHGSGDGGLPQAFKFYFANQSMVQSKQKWQSPSITASQILNGKIPLSVINARTLTFDLFDMNPDSQKKFSLCEYSQFIYFHFVYKTSKYKIQFSDTSIVKYIEDSLFVDGDGDDTNIYKKNINPKIYDKMWNAVFRYLHQMTYEPFVIWMNTK